MGKREAELTEVLSGFDVVLCHYWNHPLLASFLGQGGLPYTRILFWCHNSGLEEPHVLPDYLLGSGASVLFTTPVSVDAHNIRSRLELNPKAFDIVPSVRALNQYLEIGDERVTRQPLSGLLYVGTVSPTKMHPDSARIFASLGRKGFNIDVVGGDQEHVLEAEVRSIGGKLTVHGWVDGVLDFYGRSQIFVYPLREGHYGSGEQVILEAMAAGLPVVVFNNPAERVIVSHGETGFIAKTAEEFIAYVIKLAQDKELYALMSKQGIARVKEKFDSVAMAKTLLNKIDAQLTRPKVKIHRQVPSGCADIGLYLFSIHSFFESSQEPEVTLDNEVDVEILFRRIIRYLDSPEKRGAWISKTKGSPFHYQQFFPESPGLMALCGLICDYIRRTQKLSATP